MGNWSSATAVVNERYELQKWRYDYIVKLIEHEEEMCHESDECDDSTDCDHSDIDPGNYNFPFENLILEGGGSKGLAYCGAVKYLEEIDVMPNIKRFAGTSSGAIMASLLAVGYTSEEIRVFVGQNLENVFKDGSYFNALGNLYRYFGYHPGQRFKMWLGEKIEEKTGSADITFEEVRHQFGRELCVVVTNLNWMRTEYCHPKTTPNMPVRSAVSMSMSIPGFFTAKWYEMFGQSDVFVDGGVSCNFPIHCFDGRGFDPVTRQPDVKKPDGGFTKHLRHRFSPQLGTQASYDSCMRKVRYRFMKAGYRWFLSMAKEDNFIQRLLLPKGRYSVYANRFKEENINTKSLGLLVFAEADQDFLRDGLEHGNPKPEKPKKETRIYKERIEKEMALKKAEKVYMRLRNAVISFQKVINEKNTDGDAITKAELKSALKDEKLSQTDVEILFGGKATAEEVMELLDHNKDGEIDQMELLNFIGELGIPLQDRSISYQRRDIVGVKGFLSRLTDTLLTNKEMARYQYSDTKRTVGINTGYVTTTDFDLEEEDKEFVIDRGYRACKKFLQDFVQDNNLQLKSGK